MAKVTVTFEDVENGMVKCEASPTWETLLAKNRSGHELSDAEGYALRSYANIVTYSKEEARKRRQDKNELFIKEKPKLWTPGDSL